MKKTFLEWVKNEAVDIEKVSKIDLKVKCFEYFVYNLIKQTKSLDELKSSNFSILKVQLLLFFLVSANTELLDIFDNFHALPYGNIEADIYKYIRHNKGEFSFFTISRFGIELKYKDELKSIG